METNVVIRPPRKHDIKAWLTLWRDYCAFYDTELPDEVCKTTWGRLMDPEIPFMGVYIATDGETGPMIGFATWVEHAVTWALGPRCYLEDLYVSPDARGKGAGEALIHAVKGQAKRDQCDKVYIMTKADNEIARGLYDKLGKETGFVRYDLEL